MKIKNTKEHCFEIASKYLKFKDFRLKETSIYITAYKKGWIKDYNWLQKESRRKWTKDATYQEALNYKSIKDFRNTSPKAYKAARDFDWLKTYTWLQKDTYDENLPIWLVYVYELENKYVYIGLTMDLKRRDYEHCYRKTKDSLCKFCYEHGINIKPGMYTIIAEKLSAKEAQALEHSTKIKYEQEEKFIILNKGITGENSGSLGSGIQKWTKENCYLAAKECKTLHDFKEQYARAYRNALKFNWIDNYTWMKKDLDTKSIVQYDLNGNFINYFLNGSNDVIKLFPKYNKHVIRQASNKNDSKHKTAYGFIWKYEQDVLDSNGNYLLKL